MADDGFSPAMLDAYFATLARQPDGGSGGGTRTPWTADNIQANAPAFMQALVEAGIDPNLTLDEVMTPEMHERVLMAEGRERARPRYQQALDRAQMYGYEGLRQRIESLVEAEAERHARRGLRRSGGIGSDAVAAPAAPAPSRFVAPPLPVGGTSSPMPTTRPAPGAASPLPSDGALAPPLPVPGAFNPPHGIDYGAPRFSPISDLPPSQYGRGGQRPTAGIALGPQSFQEERDLASEPNPYNMLLEVSGLGSVGRSQRAFAEGRPLEGVGHAGLAAIRYPAGRTFGLGALGGAYGAATAQTFFPGMAHLTSTAEAEQPEQDNVPAQFIPMDQSAYFSANRTQRRSLADLQTEAEKEVRRSKPYLDFMEDGQTTRANRLIDQARTNAEKTYRSQETSLQGETERLGAEYDKYVERMKKAREEYLKGRTSAGEYERAVRAAEKIKREWDARADQEWVHTPVGQLNEALGGLGPAVAGMVGGAATRVAGRALGHGDSFMAHRVAPGVMGGFFGATMNNAPVIYNANQLEVRNPERVGLERALLALPPDHPLRPVYEARLRDTTTLPLLNPIQKNAQDSLGFWPGQPGFLPTVGRSIYGFALEGAPGGMLGSELAVGAPGVRGVASRLRGRDRAAPTATGGTPGGSGPAVGPGSPSAAAEPSVSRLGSRPPAAPPPVEPVPPPVPTAGRIPTLDERRARPNPDDPRGDWVPRTDPVVPGVTRYVSPQGRNEVFRDAGGNWQRRLPNGRTEFIGGPPPNYRRISQAEPNLLAAYG